MKQTSYILPAYWASSLINSDESGMEDQDIVAMNEWLQKEQPGYCVGVGESYFAPYNDADNLGSDVAEFTFHKQPTHQ